MPGEPRPLALKWAVLALMALGVPPVVLASAQDPAAAPAGTDGGADGAAADPEKALVERAVRAYDEGRFDEAVADFSEGYRLYRKPPYLFNLGQAQRQQKKCGDALGAYRQFLSEAPADDERRPLATRRVAEMQKCV